MDKKLEEFDQAADVIRQRILHQPQIGLILGSGLGKLAEECVDPITIPYHEIPNWPISTVPGHKGQLVCGLLEEKPVLIMQGRIHFYEGYSMEEVTFPVRVMQRLGIKTLIITNAAGGVNPSFEAGDIMLITDHLNLIGMAGFSPLRGPNIDELGERFTNMSQAYDRKLCELTRRVAQKLGIPLREGVYVCLAGPSFETPADIRFLYKIGVDAVGMSTVPEVTVARHGNQRVLGLSSITNKASHDGEKAADHKEVLEVGNIIVPKLSALLKGVLREFDYA